MTLQNMYLKNRALTDFNGISPDDSVFVVGDGTKFVGESGTTARTSLGVGAGDGVTLAGLSLGAVVDTVNKLVINDIIPNGMRVEYTGAETYWTDYSANSITISDAGSQTFKINTVSGGIVPRLVIISEGVLLGNIGYGGEIAPETLAEYSSTVPYLTLHNTTEEDGDGGRESRLIFKGEQSGTEETTLARIEVSHDGAVDDQKGKIQFYTNSGADADAPTLALTIASSGNAAIAGFATLGSDAPAIKMKEYTSTTGATEGSEITIAHGLTTSKIIGIQALIDDGANILVPPSFTANAGWQYDVWINSTNIHLKLHDTNSEDVLSKSVKIILTYEE